MGDDSPKDDGVLSPEDIDLRDDDRVVELEENRFFVSVSDESPADKTPGCPTDDARPDSTDDRERESRGNWSSNTGPGNRIGSPDGEDVSRPLAESVERTSGYYAIAAAVKTDEGVREHVVDSNNVAETFEAFLRWYADRVGEGRASQEEVLRVLLDESDLDL